MKILVEPVIGPPYAQDEEIDLDGIRLSSPVPLPGLKPHFADLGVGPWYITEYVHKRFDYEHEPAVALEVRRRDSGAYLRQACRYRIVEGGLSARLVEALTAHAFRQLLAWGRALNRGDSPLPLGPGVAGTEVLEGNEVVFIVRTST